jgi:hypothetical protein
MATVFQAPANEILDLGGFHLAEIPNGSFEQGSVGAVPTGWTGSGDGTAAVYFLGGEPNEPQVPLRGVNDLRLTTGPSASSTVFASSGLIQAMPGTTYTTTANLRFGWSGDPNPQLDPVMRPQVLISFNYFQSPGVPSAVKPQDVFRYFQEDTTNDFQTFPFRYTTPSDATMLTIQIGAERINLPPQIVFDADNFR